MKRRANRQPGMRMSRESGIKEKAMNVNGKRSGSGSKIAPCSCQSAYQDKRYGAGRRVHNCATKGLRCTVCGKAK